ncbi:SocA family protein [Salegentibacter mishustinae]|jgi:uncharacterized phage-associated protein/DNA-binding transcriptional regulator YiaG|uniref:SocA family protein n=1 Tax=Salegentibacter mishustinae TaxID=270918 RepID=UPI001CE04626|nr:SocA family protein [Salegentibacter mishustinae]UBZ08274.1 SocA family protein [Salegentibacter mishustinae]
MKSPITGKEMILSVKDSTVNFRNEEFTIKYKFYLCEDTQEEFTTTELDTLNLNQIHNQYRDKHNLPFTDEISQFREDLKISAKLMSKVFGFGTNVYRNYENGEVPSLSNGKMIYQSINNLRFLKTLVEDSSDLKASEKAKLFEAIKKLRGKAESYTQQKHFLALVQKEKFPNNRSGYKNLNLDKFGQMVGFFAESQEPSEVKLNKLLFYADFYHFNKTGYSISGAQYRAIDYGPVPNNYDILFNYAEKSGVVRKDYRQYSENIHGKHYIANEDFLLNKDFFTEEELESLKTVAARFKDFSATKIKDVSHEEDAWICNSEEKSIIDYSLAFTLKNI